MEHGQRRPRLPRPPARARARRSSGASACSPALTPSTYAVDEGLRLLVEVGERPLRGVDDPGPPGQDVPARSCGRRAPRPPCRWPGGAGTPAARRGPGPRRTPARGRGRARRRPGRAGRRTRRGRSGPRGDPTGSAGDVPEAAPLEVLVGLHAPRTWCSSRTGRPRRAARGSAGRRRRSRRACGERLSWLPVGGDR